LKIENGQLFAEAHQAKASENCSQSSPSYASSLQKLVKLKQLKIEK